MAPLPFLPAAFDVSVAPLQQPGLPAGRCPFFLRLRLCRQAPGGRAAVPAYPSTPRGAR